MINQEDRSIRCSCESFYNRGFCKHTKSYKKIIAKILYGEDFVEKVIKNFKNCYDLVEELCELYPECIGNYDQLDHISRQILDAVGSHYRTETIHRSYRKLVEDGKIVEPEETTIRKEKTEQIMHDINKWSPKTYLTINSPQSQLTDNDLGVTK